MPIVRCKKPKTNNEVTKAAPALKPGWQIIVEAADAILNAPHSTSNPVMNEMAGTLLEQCRARAVEIIPKDRLSEVTNKIMCATDAITKDWPVEVEIFLRNHLELDKISYKDFKAFVIAQKNWATFPYPSL